MNINEIEQKIVSNEMSASQVFTQMKQHIEAAKTKTLGEIEKPYYEWRQHQEGLYFSVLMKTVRNNQSKATMIAGINRGTLRKKLKLCNLL